MNVTLSAKYRIRALLRENALTDSRVEALLRNERLPDDRLRALQENELRKTLEAASRRLPAYNKLRVPAGDIFQFLETLPIITKENLLSDRRNFVPNLGSRQLWTPRGLTSGTT